ncbi:MAG: hypothetical protein ACFFCS_19985 [Candidatus Hodarchaeota archaeon]
MSDVDTKKEKDAAKDAVYEKFRAAVTRAHSFKEMGMERRSDKDYDILHFPHIWYAAGVIMAVYGYYISYISEGSAAFFDGLIIMIIGNIFTTLGMLYLLKKYRQQFFLLIITAILIAVIMMALWDGVLVPYGAREGILTPSTRPFWERVGLVMLTIMTFAYAASFIWFIAARYTSALYYKIFETFVYRGGKRQLFIVDPWRKTVATRTGLIRAVFGRIFYPLLFVLAILQTISSTNVLVIFIEIDWSDYFQSVLITFLLLIVMVTIFPAFWLLDYVRYYKLDSLEVQSLGERVLLLIKGYSGVGVIFSFISFDNIAQSIISIFQLTLYLVPTLLILVGAYLLLTERDIFYIAEKVTHGDKVVADYKLIDSKGQELKWWIGTKDKKGGLST